MHGRCNAWLTSRTASRPFDWCQFLLLVKQKRKVLRHVCIEWALLSFHSVCLSVWMSVGHFATYSHDWSITTKFKPFWIPVSHTLGASGKNMQNFAYFQHVDSGSRQILLVYNSWSFANIWAQYSPSTYASTHVGFFDLCPNVQMAAL